LVFILQIPETIYTQTSNKVLTSIGFIKAANTRVASYSNLGGGTYVFNVKASNNDGIWVEQPELLILKVIPSF